MSKNLNRGWTPLLKSYPDSEKINALSFAAETLFTRLLAKADDNANFSSGKKTLLGQLYSKKWEDGRISVRKVGNLLTELITHGLVKTYEHGGREFLHILNCKKALRSDSHRDIRFPPAPPCIQTCIQELPASDTDMYTLDKTIREQNRTEETTEEKHKPNISVKKPHSPTDEEKTVFDTARKLYPSRKRGLDTEFANFRKQHHDWQAAVILLAPAIEAQKTYRDSAVGFVPEWKNFQTWINQRCWEEEVPQSRPVNPKEIPYAGASTQLPNL